MSCPALSLFHGLEYFARAQRMSSNEYIHFHTQQNSESLRDGSAAAARGGGESCALSRELPWT